MKMEHKIDLVMVDYLQLMHAPKAESREREISVISHTLKAVAKELNIPVIALSQLNRTLEARADKRPMLSDLRESGSIEQDADVVMFIHRPEYYKITAFEDGRSTENIAEIIVGKQRNGPTGDIRLFYQKELAAFHDLTFNRDAFDVAPDVGLLPESDAPF
jgi:replicative DNA helicase